VDANIFVLNFCYHSQPCWLYSLDFCCTTVTPWEWDA